MRKVHILSYLVAFALSASLPSPGAPAILPLHRRDEQKPVVLPPFKGNLDIPLPAQVGCILGAYGITLLTVASLLFILSRRRSNRIKAGADESAAAKRTQIPLANPSAAPSSQGLQSPPLVIPPFVYTTSVKTLADEVPYHSCPDMPYKLASSSNAAINVTPMWDPLVNSEDIMAARKDGMDQLAQLYELAYQQEEREQAERGVKQDADEDDEENNDEDYGKEDNRQQNTNAYTISNSPTSPLKKTRAKPVALRLNRNSQDVEEQPPNTATRKRFTTSSLFSALRSPRRKREISISAPIMTPLSSRFAPEQQEMQPMSPRFYIPVAPPALPGHAPAPMGGAGHSIAERLGTAAPTTSARSNDDEDEGPSDDADKGGVSPESMHSQAPLVGLPLSPLPRLSTLPASPRPGAGFSIPTPVSASSAVRPGGVLPFRMYEGVPMTPATVVFKQTTFERGGMLSPSGVPMTGMAVPYTPYQPFSPCVPMTPSLVTKADRRRMKKLEPKTPTMEMVRDDNDVW